MESAQTTRQGRTDRQRQVEHAGTSEKTVAERRSSNWYRSEHSVRAQAGDQAAGVGHRGDEQLGSGFSSASRIGKRLAPYCVASSSCRSRGPGG